MGVEAIPVSIAEEYYQINLAILESFPKYRPPLDLFVFKEDIAQLLTYAHKGDRLSNEQVEEVHTLCENGDLFVSRADHAVYSKHIVKQLDLILIDKNLKDSEIADICILALSGRLEDFFSQPVKAVFDDLYSDTMVVTEYLWGDFHRLKLFMRRLHQGAHNLPRHSINTMTIGLWLLAFPQTPGLQRKNFDQAALALLLHDVGMSKIPPFITSKTSPLKPEEKEKIPAHTLAGYKIMHKLDQTYDAMKQALLEHHERLDGSGYPQHSKRISSFGLLVAVADSFSAMIQARPYAAAKDMVAAARELTDAKHLFDIAYSGKLLATFVSEGFGKKS